MEEDRVRPIVGALIFNREGKILLMRSHKWKDKYMIPGGHIEFGETMKEALIREVKEETNLDIKDIEFVQFQECIFDNTFWKKRHFIFFDFACKTDSTDVKLNEEAQEFGWFSIKEALKLDADIYTIKTIKKYTEQNKSKMKKLI